MPISGPGLSASGVVPSFSTAPWRSTAPAARVAMIVWGGGMRRRPGIPLHRGCGASDRRQSPSLLADASGGDERHRVDRRHLDDITGVWGMDHEPLADVNADVADRAVEEDQ